MHHVEKFLVKTVALQKAVSRAKEPIGSSAEAAFPQPRFAASNGAFCTKQTKVHMECIHISCRHQRIKYGPHMWLERHMWCLHGQNKAKNTSKTPVGERLQAT